MLSKAEQRYKTFHRSGGIEVPWTRELSRSGGNE